MHKRVVLTFFVGVLILLFAFSLFRNLSYPLIWGDESETAVFGQRILQYGYPKVHSDKYSLNLKMIPGEGVGVKEEFDAHIVSVWGQYYVAALGEYFAQNTADIYQKTSTLRLPFAILGFLGVMILPFALGGLFKNNFNLGAVFWIFFYFFQLLSVSLVLHLREVRSYSLAVFFSALVFYIFIRFYFFKNISKWIYSASIIVVLFLLYNSFPPGFLAVVLFLGTFTLLENLALRYKTTTPSRLVENLIQTNNQKDFWVSMIPIIISVFLSLPIMLFFENSHTSSQAYNSISYGLPTYMEYLTRIIKFLSNYHYLYLAIILKVIIYFVFKRLLSKPCEQKPHINSLFLFLRMSNFLTWFMLVYTLSIALTPYFFDRYFIILQPLLSMVIVLDSIIIFRAINIFSDVNKKSQYQTLFVYLLSIVFILTTINKTPVLTGRIYELTHRYVGPMDMIIEYIQDNYPNPQDLTIYTNHEMTVYTYYLDSVVVCDDYDSCFPGGPDLIIPRSYFIGEEFIERANGFMEENEYSSVRLPIWDYPANNIPELSISLRHLFKSPLTDNPDQMVVLYLKNEKDQER